MDPDIVLGNDIQAAFPKGASVDKNRLFERKFEMILGPRERHPSITTSGVAGSFEELTQKGLWR